MKPAPFKYIEASDEDALVAALAEHGDEARLLAGGQSLVPMMNFRIVSPAVLIDFNRISSLSYIDCGEGRLRIGALARHAMIEDSEAVTQHCPLLAKAIRHVAHRAVRNRGTTGGSLAMAYPGAEIPLVLMTLGAEVRLNSSRGGRRLAIGGFLRDALDTALEPDEYICGVTMPLPPEESVAGFVETTRRHGDFALAAAAVVVSRDGQGKLAFLRAGVSGGTGAPARLVGFESDLLGQTFSERLVTDAANEAIEAIEVFGDHHYPEDYRRHLLKAALCRALTDALGKTEQADAG